MKKKKRKKTVCKWCAYLFIFNGIALCLSRASFKSDPIDRMHDVVGVRQARIVNLSNRCKQKKIISFKSLILKWWLIRDSKKRKVVKP